MDKEQFFMTALGLLLLSSALFGGVLVKLADANFLPLPEHQSGIYLRNDGTLDPSAAPIQQVGDLYYLTGDVHVGIAVERSDVLIKGQGYRLVGNGSGTGFYLHDVENVTIQDMDIQNFRRGIYLESCKRSTVQNNGINCGTGIEVTQNSRYNQILSNDLVSGGIVNSGHADGTVIARNNVTGHSTGISVKWSSNVTIKDNQVATDTNINEPGNPFGDRNYGINLDNSNHSRLYDNLIERNRYGIHFWHCLNFTLSGNVFRDNDCGIQIEASHSSKILTSHRIDTSNTINGRPVYYLVNQHDAQVPSNAGWIALINCTNMTVNNLDLPPNGDGIFLAYTRHSTIANSTVTGSFNAILLQEASNCTITENFLNSSGYSALYFDGTVDCTVTENVIMENYCIFGMRHNSERNTFFHNNFIHNEWIGAFDRGQNTWDNGSEGNYWDNYNGTDTNDDGIGDAPYVIDNRSHNVDRYPLTEPVDTAVIPEFPSRLVLPLFLTVTLTVVVLLRRMKTSYSQEGMSEK